MPSKYLLLILAGIAAVPAAAQRNVPLLQPGVYGARYSCPGAASVPVVFYVLNEFEDRGYKNDKARYQRVRVQAGDSLFSGSAILNGMDQLRIIVTEWERTSAKGRSAYPDTYDFSGRFETLDGTAWGSKEIVVAGGGREMRAVECSLRADPGASRTAQPLASMGHAVEREPVKVDHNLHRGGVPPAFVPFTPDPGVARALADAAARTIGDDSQNWLVHRLKAGSVGDFHYFRSGGDPASLYVWAGYTYVAGDGWDSGGWAAVRFVNGGVECIQYHNKAGCSRPRIGRSAQMARLGEGRRSLPPIRVSPSCFKPATRMEQRSRQVVVYADRRGEVDTRTEYYSVPVTYTVFACPSQSYAFDCVAEGTDRVTEWMVGTGTTRSHRLVLTQSGATNVTSAEIERYNRRIGDKSCVRTE